MILRIEQAKIEAKLIARRASDWLNGKEEGTILAARGVVLAKIQGAADNLVRVLEDAGRARARVYERENPQFFEKCPIQ